MVTNPPIPRRLDVSRETLTLGGRTLRDVTLGGIAYGPPPGTAPMIVLVGGITASPLPFGGEGVEPWWPALLGPELVDPTRHTVLCPAWPGNGTTWAGFDDPNAPVPALSVLDLADLAVAWLDGIGATGPVTYVGASLGGLVGVALASRHPARVERLVSISAGLRPDGWGTATRHLQRELVRDGLRTGDVSTGMMRARQLGMLTYRGRDELDTRFGKLAEGLERPPVADYLDHHGRRFAATFPVRTFLLLSEAIDRSSLAPSPEELRTALARVTAEVTVIGVPGDMLFPWALQVELHRELQAVGAKSSLWKLASLFGHDAFLADQEELATLLRHAGALDGGRRAGPVPPLGRQPLREIRLGLVGCGVVGQGVLALLAQREGELAGRYGVRFVVSKIAVRDAAKDRGPHAIGISKTTRPLELVADPTVDVVVEVAGGQAMNEVVRAALAAGKPVVTANKALLAQELAGLAELARRTETPLACEAAACAALPIFRHLNVRADEVDSLLAIANGTCNFVLTRLEQDEQPILEAVKRAQELGHAEADPSMDLDGHDAAAKLVLLVYRAFGVWIRPQALPVRGIRELTPVDCDLAAAFGQRIRHIIHATRNPGALTVGVEPMLLPSWHLLASVEEEYNAVYLSCPAAGDLSFFGKGSGGAPTATAVLGDLIDLALDNASRWPAPSEIPSHPPGPRRHYVRVSGEGADGLVRRIEAQVKRAGLTIEQKASRKQRAGERAHVAVMVGTATTAQMGDLVDELRRLGGADEVLCLGVLG